MSISSDSKQVADGVKCFRLRRDYLVIGIVGTAFFCVMGVTSTVVAYWNIDGSFARQQLTALIFGLFWSGFMLLGVWIILAYFRGRLFLARNMVVQHGIFRSRKVDFEDVICINWRGWPVRGSIVVRTHSQRVVIDLDNFALEDREEIVRCFRETFAEEIQDNWSRFQDYDRKFSRPQRLASRGGIVVTASVLLCGAGVFVYCWFVGLGVQNLLIGVINAIAALWYLWRFWTYKDHNSTQEVASHERSEC
jgi:hypothetical protein